MSSASRLPRLSWPLRFLIIINKNSTKLCVCALLILHAFLSPAFLFKNNSFRNTIRVSNSLDPDQARHFITSTSKVASPPRWNTVLSRGHQLHRWNKQLYLYTKKMNFTIKMQPNIVFKDISCYKWKLFELSTWKGNSACHPIICIHNINTLNMWKR